MISKTPIDPIGKLMGLRYKSHPWHGINIGDNAPQVVTSFVEMVTTDTVKYEIDKVSGYLKIDRPNKYSNLLPALYGFIPQTHSGINVANISSESLKRPEIIGDNDPIDICILTEKQIMHGDILVQAIPIGGFRMIDNNSADDKIIGVLKGDAVYGQYKDLKDCPEPILERLRHYFLTYKDMPGVKGHCEVTHVYGAEEAHKVIKAGMKDYRNYVENMLFDKINP